GTRAVGNGLVAAEGRDANAIGCDTKLDQPLAHGVRALARQGHVVVAGARVIGVAFHDDDEPGLALEPMRLRLNGGTRAHAELGAAVSKKDAVPNARAEVAADPGRRHVWHTELHALLGGPQRRIPKGYRAGQNEGQAERSTAWHVACSPTLDASRPHCARIGAKI